VVLRWRHQVRRKPESVTGRRRVLLVQARVVVMRLLLLLLVMSGCCCCGSGCGGGGHGVGPAAAAAATGQLVVKAGRALHRRPLVPQVLAAGRGRGVVYAAQRAVRAADRGCGRGRAQEQLRPGREHGTFLGRQLAQAAGRVQQRRPEHVVLAQHRFHRFPGTREKRFTVRLCFG